MAQKNNKTNKKGKETKKVLINKIKKIRFLNIALVVIIISLLLFIIVHFIVVEHGPKEIKVINNILDNNYVFLGDSITEGYDLNKYYSDYPVVNSGIGGYTTIKILEKMDTMVYRYNPTKVFLLIGTNDIAHKESKEDIINNIDKIIDKIKANRKYTKIYVESIYPIDDEKEHKRDNKLINDINKDVKELCNKKGVEYINIHDLLMDDDGNLRDEYSNDGLHLTDQGYEVVTKELKKYLN